MGQTIDQFDTVFRVNLTDASHHPQDRGTRTDVRLIGGTMLPHHAEILRRITQDCWVVSTQKNISQFQELGIDAAYYEKQLPKRAFQMLAKHAPGETFGAKKIKPPRSGIVSLALILTCSRPKSVTLAGFSKTMDTATTSISFVDGSVYTYDPKALQDAHCDLKFEIDALLLLEERGVIQFL